MPNSDDPMRAVLQYVEAFNSGDSTAMAAACADPMQILDGMRLMSGRGRPPPRTGGETCFPRANTWALRVPHCARRATAC